MEGREANGREAFGHRSRCGDLPPRFRVVAGTSSLCASTMRSTRLRWCCLAFQAAPPPGLRRMPSPERRAPAGGEVTHPPEEHPKQESVELNPLLRSLLAQDVLSNHEHRFDGIPKLSHSLVPSERRVWRRTVFAIPERPCLRSLHGNWVFHRGHALVLELLEAPCLSRGDLLRG